MAYFWFWTSKCNVRFMDFCTEISNDIICSSVDIQFTVYAFIWFYFIDIQCVDSRMSRTHLCKCSNDWHRCCWWYNTIRSNQKTIAIVTDFSVHILCTQIFHHLEDLWKKKKTAFQLNRKERWCRTVHERARRLINDKSIVYTLICECI